MSPAELTAHDGYLGCLVHNLALIDGIVDHYGAGSLELASAATWTKAGVDIGVVLPGGGHGRMAHLKVAGVPSYRERVTVYCSDRILELVFPSPYLRHVPTRLRVRRADGAMGLDETDIRVSYEEPFRTELRAFHASVAEGAPVRCDARGATSSIELLSQAFAMAVSCPQP